MIEHRNYEIIIFKSTKRTFYKIFSSGIFKETHDNLKAAKYKIDFCIDRGVWEA